MPALPPPKDDTSALSVAFSTACSSALFVLQYRLDFIECLDGLPAFRLHGPAEQFSARCSIGFGSFHALIDDGARWSSVSPLSPYAVSGNFENTWQAAMADALLMASVPYFQLSLDFFDSSRRRKGSSGERVYLELAASTGNRKKNTKNLERASQGVKCDISGAGY